MLNPNWNQDDIRRKIEPTFWDKKSGFNNMQSRENDRLSPENNDAFFWKTRMWWTSTNNRIINNWIRREIPNRQIEPNNNINNISNPDLNRSVWDLENRFNRNNERRAIPENINPMTWINNQEEVRQPQPITNPRLRSRSPLWNPNPNSLNNPLTWQNSRDRNITWERIRNPLWNIQEWNKQSIPFNNWKQVINNNISTIEDNLKKDTQELQKQERFLYLWNIIWFAFFYTIFVDIYNLFELNSNSFHNIFKAITTFNQMNINDLLVAFNVLFLSFLILLLLLPQTINKNIRNHVYIYSLKIEYLIRDIFKNWIFNIDENRDEIVKIIFLVLINTFIIIFYHISINTIFNYQDNQVGVLRTLIYWTLLFWSVVYYNHQFDDIIINIIKNNLVQSRKDVSKIIFTLIWYTIGIVLIIFWIKYVADFIYNFFYAFDILKPFLQKM